MNKNTTKEYFDGEQLKAYRYSLGERKNKLCLCSGEWGW